MSLHFVLFGDVTMILRPFTTLPDPNSSIRKDILNILKNIIKSKYRIPVKELYTICIGILDKYEEISEQKKEYTLSLDIILGRYSVNTILSLDSNNNIIAI